MITNPTERLAQNKTIGEQVLECVGNCKNEPLAEELLRLSYECERLRERITQAARSAQRAFAKIEESAQSKLRLYSVNPLANSNVYELPALIASLEANEESLRILARPLLQTVQA